MGLPRLCRLGALAASIAAIMLASATSGPVQAEPAAPADLSTPLRGVATASSALPDAPPRAAVDDLSDTSWQAADRGAAWLVIDLGRPAWVTKVQQTFGTTDVWSFAVQGSLDGEDWVGLLDRRAGAAGVTFAQATSGMYRYLRLTVDGSDGNHRASSREFVAHGSDNGGDLTAGATASASSHAAEFPADRALDQNTSTYWKAASVDPQWLQVDLGVIAQVTAVRQDFAEYGKHAFAIEGSSNGRSWTGLGQYATTGQSFTTTVPRARYRYLRLSVSAAPDGTVATSAGLTVYGFADLAVGGTSTASSATPDHPATAATDGEATTSWRSAADGAAWLQSDLGSQQWISRLRQVSEAGGATVELQASADGAAWVDLRPRHAGDITTATVDAAYRFVRIRSTGDGVASSRSLEVFGTPITRNLAHNARVTASTDGGSGWTPDLAVDGKPGTYWLASSAEMPQQLTADLGNDCLIGTVSFTLHDTDSWKFTIKGSHDGRSWTTLLDRSDGVRGKRFSTPVDDSYRLIRITQTGSAAVHWANVGELEVQGIGSPTNDRWYDTTGSVFRFFPKDDPYTPLTTITDRLPELRRQGYTAIEVAPPYQGAARQQADDYFAGLGATNNYAIDPHIGTMADWNTLINTAHTLGMHVIMFGNLGYADVAAPFFRQAIEDFRSGVDSPERNWFLLDSKPRGDRWYEYKNTGVWYYAYWGVHDPTYDWSGPAWQAEAAKILRFWADTGIDGMGLDAPPAYYGFSQELNNRVIIDTLRPYGISTMPEGIQPTAPPDKIVDQVDFEKWVTDWKYTTIQDLWVEHWGNPAYSRIMLAADNADASTLEAAMAASRDAITARGGITLSSASWPLDYDGSSREVDPTVQRSVSKRLLEASTLTSMGTMNYLINAADWMHPDLSPEEIPSWTAKQRSQLEQIYRAQAGYPALGPTGARVGLPTHSDSSLAYLRRDSTGSVTALVVLNFSGTAQDVTVDLANTGVSSDQTPTDLLTGKAATPIRSTSYAVGLPAYGYRELAVG